MLSFLPQSARGWLYRTASMGTDCELPLKLRSSPYEPWYHDITSLLCSLDWSWYDDSLGSRVLWLSSGSERLCRGPEIGVSSVSSEREVFHNKNLLGLKGASWPYEFGQVMKDVIARHVDSRKNNCSTKNKQDIWYHHKMIGIRDRLVKNFVLLLQKENILEEEEGGIYILMLP